MAYVKRNTASHSMLKHMFYVPVAGLKDMQFLVARDEKTRGTVSSGLKRLLEKGLAEPVPQMAGSYRITPLGVSAICVLEESCAMDREGHARVSTVYCRKHAEEFSVRALCAGIGIRTYPPEKPEFAELAAMLNPSIDVSRFIKGENVPGPQGRTLSSEPRFTYGGREGIKGLLSDGMYYSSAEVRAGIKRTGLGLEDVANGTRMSGLIIRGRKLYLIYTKVSDTVIWKDDWENGLIGVLKETMFRGCLDGKPAGIFMSRSYSLAPTLALGCRYGRLKSERCHAEAVLKEAEGMEGLERERFLSSKEYARERELKFREEKKRHSAYLNTTAGAVGEIFCVPLRPAYAVDMYWTVSTDRDRHVNGGRLWFSRHGGFQTVDTGNIFSGMSLSDGTEAAYVAVMDCRLLAEIRETGKRTAVVTRPELAPYISHVLGPLAASFHDMETGERITGVPAYDRFGYPEGEAEKKKPAAETEKAAAEAKSCDLRTWVSPEVKEYYAGLSKANGISLSGLFSMALGRCMDDPSYMEMVEEYRRSHTGRNAGKK